MDPNLDELREARFMAEFLAKTIMGELIGCEAISENDRLKGYALKAHAALYDIAEAIEKEHGK